MTTTTRSRSPETHVPEKITNNDCNDQSPTYSRDRLVDDVYYTTRSKLKSDVILLKMDSCDTWKCFSHNCAILEWNSKLLMERYYLPWVLQMYGYMFKLAIFVCDLGDIDCIFGLDAWKEAGFITCARTGRIWFNANKHDKPRQLSRSSCNAICHLRTVQRIELKPFKAITIEVAYAKRVMFKRWDES